MKLNVYVLKNTLSNLYASGFELYPNDNYASVTVVEPQVAIDKVVNNINDKNSSVQVEERVLLDTVEQWVVSVMYCIPSHVWHT